jgi:hypothetical protein
MLPALNAGANRIPELPTRTGATLPRPAFGRLRPGASRWPARVDAVEGRVRGTNRKRRELPLMHAG